MRSTAPDGARGWTWCKPRLSPARWLVCSLALTRWEGLFAALYSFLVSIVVIVTLLNQGFFPDLSMHDAIVSIAERNVAWLTALVNRTPAADNLIFVIQLCLLGWWLSFFAIWSLYRHQHVCRLSIPAGIGLLVVIYYSPIALSGYLVVYLVSVVLLRSRASRP